MLLTDEPIPPSSSEPWSVHLSSEETRHRPSVKTHTNYEYNAGKITLKLFLLSNKMKHIENKRKET